jgi:urocanate hydratase
LSSFKNKSNKEYLLYYKAKPYEDAINHAPKRKEILSADEKKLALRALRYFEAQHHEELIQEFRQELETYGRIYMYRFRPDYEMRARLKNTLECEQAKLLC